VSTITAEHQLGAELRQRALSEIVPGIVCIPHVNFGRECFMFMPDWPQNDHLTTKASYLARMEMFGPEHPTVCPDHMQAGRPDLWDACRKVSVASALLGRTCGAP